MRRLAAAFTFFALAGIFFTAPGALLFLEFQQKAPSHWNPFKPLDLKAPSTFVQRWKIAAAREDGALCRAAIKAAGISATRRDDEIRSENCSLLDTVALRKLGAMSMTQVDTRCSVALSLYVWEREVVQPAAQKFFGEKVQKLLHFGSYSCRRIKNIWRWSQHARANAVDVAGFKLKSGKEISVLRDWPQKSDASRFLRVVREGACDHFAMVLGPDYNEAHRDHFHFDHGFWTGCR